MFVSKTKFDDLQEEVQELRNALWKLREDYTVLKVRSTVPGAPADHYGPSAGFRLIMEHLGLEFEYLPKTSGKLTIKEKEKTE